MVRTWLEAAGRAPDRAGVFLDFDGTLAPIVDDPAGAVPQPGALEVLGALSRRWGRVAVVSGRPVSYLAQRVGESAGATELAGLYGLERCRADSRLVTTDPAAERWRPAVAEAADRAEASAPAGVAVERKGLTVTLHYRAAPDRAEWVERFAAGEQRRLGLEAHGGKMSIELRPPVPVDKGTVVYEMGSGLDAVLFAGDDRGDLPAFEALARLRAEGRTTLAVASGGSETPAEVVRAADLVADGPAGIVAVLRDLLA